MSSYRNAILDALSAAEPGFLEGRLTPFSFVHGDVLVRAGKPIEHVYFPQSGLISIVVELGGGERIETAMIGHDGVLGASVVFGADLALNTGVAQIAGQGWRMKASDLVLLVEKSRSIELLLFRHEQYVLAQAQQTAACNARHHIPARLCTWLLRAQDVSAQPDLYLTQEVLAQILGVQRASISLIAGTLQDAGLIQYRRGRIVIINRQGLAGKACECYRTLRQHRQGLLHAEDASTLT